MKRAFWYSGLVFLAIFAVMTARFAAGLVKGLSHADDFLLFLVVSGVASLFPSIALFFVLKWFFNKEPDKQYKPSKNLFMVFGVVVFGLSVLSYVQELKTAVSFPRNFVFQ